MQVSNREQLIRIALDKQASKSNDCLIFKVASNRLHLYTTSGRESRDKLLALNSNRYQFKAFSDHKNERTLILVK